MECIFLPRDLKKTHPTTKKEMWLLLGFHHIMQTQSIFVLICLWCMQSPTSQTHDLEHWLQQFVAFPNQKKMQDPKAQTAKIQQI
jgi:hypothetical protein